MHTPKSLAAVALAALFLTACGSTGLGDVLGGGGGGMGQQSNYEIRGTVDYVDPNNQTLQLTNVSGYSSMLSNGGSGSTVRVHFQNDTRVDYQGQTFRPADLERGDEVVVRVDESGNRLMANSITVTYDATNNNNTGSNTNNNGTWGNNSQQRSTIRGTVGYIDTSRQTFELESANWVNGFNTGAGGSNMNRIVVQYGNNTQISVNGQMHPINGLERGDVVEVEVSPQGSTYWAQRVWLVRDARR